MKFPTTYLVAPIALVMLVGVCWEPAAAGAEITAAQRTSLDEILTTVSAKAVSAGRTTCMMGEEPQHVIEGRNAGKSFLPDAADTCVAVLVRTAHDHALPEIYRTLLTQLGGDTALADKLPLAIGNAVLDGDGKVALGNGKVTKVPPTLAFDAGFSVAYLKGDTRAADTDPNKLKALTEACLAVQKDAGTCFSAGYVQGGRALKAE